MNKQQKGRWANAQKMYHKLQNKLDDGYLLYDENDDLVKGLELNEEGFFQVYDEYSKCFLFLNDTELDNGMYTPIKEFNEQFKDWYFINPRVNKESVL